MLRTPAGLTQAIRDFPKECREPTILFITHAGLQLSDLSAYRDWHLMIDEVPNCWFSDELKKQATWQWFADTYNLTHVSASWSQVTPKVTTPTLARIQEDSLGNQIAVLAGRIRDTRSGVFASVAQLGRHGGGRPSGRWLAVVRCLESRMPAAVQTGVDAGRQSEGLRPSTSGRDPWTGGSLLPRQPGCFGPGGS